MNRAGLEHVIRAAATISGDSEIVVVGSNAILGRYPDAPAELCISADVEGWEARLIPVRTESGTGLCLEPHDLLISKYMAGREKVREYTRAAARHRLADLETLLARLEVAPGDATRRAGVRERIVADFA